jgi:hypothetical protein
MPYSIIYPCITFLKMLIFKLIIKQQPFYSSTKRIGI